MREIIHQDSRKMTIETTVDVVTSDATATTNTAPTGGRNMETQKKNRIQVSNTKKPLFFYVNLAKVPLSHPLCAIVFLSMYCLFWIHLG